MRERGLRPVATASAAVAVVLAVCGCGGGGGGGQKVSRPARLLDGSRPPSLPHALASVARDAVPARVRVLRVAELDVRGRRCVSGFRPEFGISPDAVVVERTGAIGATLTFTDAGKRVALGCDRTVRPGANGPWCARSVGRRFAGGLRDARIDILCVGARGTPVGFGWLEPTPGVHWIVVGKGHGAEVEQVAAGLPVRVTTETVEPSTSSATFAVIEYDERGREVDRYRLEAHVAG